MAAFGFLISRQQPDLLLCDYWAKARCDGGWRVEFAFKRPLSVRDLLPELDSADIGVYDLSEQEHKAFWFDADSLTNGVYLSRKPVKVARAWACEQLLLSHIMKTRSLLAAGRARTDQADRGAVVCSCYGAGSKEILSAINSGYDTVALVGKACKAGTNCGSCQCEISEFIASSVMSSGSETREHEIESL